jgi:hypothetical protein
MMWIYHASAPRVTCAVPVSWPEAIGNLDQAEKLGRRENGYTVTAARGLEMLEIARYQSVGRSCSGDFEKR